MLNVGAFSSCLLGYLSCRAARSSARRHPARVEKAAKQRVEPDIGGCLCLTAEGLRVIGHKVFVRSSSLIVTVHCDWRKKSGAHLNIYTRHSSVLFFWRDKEREREKKRCSGPLPGAGFILFACSMMFEWIVCAIIRRCLIGAQVGFVGAPLACVTHAPSVKSENDTPRASCACLFCLDGRSSGSSAR